MLRALGWGGAGLAGVLIALELVLRALPVSTASMLGYHHGPDLLTPPAGHRWTVSTGWDLRNPQRLVANNWGFVADRDFAPDPRAVALIGDSHVEASMLPATDRPGAQLERLLDGQRPVYALGAPGTALLDHAERVLLAARTWQVRDMVLLLESGDIRQALCGSGNVHSHCLDPATLAPRRERHAEPSALKRLLRHSALAQYFASQIKLRGGVFLAELFTRQVPELAGHGGDDTPGADATAAAAPAPEAVRQARRLVDAVLAQFFARLAEVPLLRLTVLLDGRRVGRSSPASDGHVERAYLVARLEARGVRVIDLEPAYARHHAGGQGLSLEIGPYDRHLNRLGVQLAMQQAAAALRQ